MPAQEGRIRKNPPDDQSLTPEPDPAGGDHPDDCGVKRDPHEAARYGEYLERIAAKRREEYENRDEHEYRESASRPPPADGDGAKIEGHVFPHVDVADNSDGLIRSLPTGSLILPGILEPLWGVKTVAW